MANKDLKIVIGAEVNSFLAGLKSAEAGLGRFIDVIKGAPLRIAAVAIAAKKTIDVFSEVITSTANYEDEMIKASQKTGVAIEALSGLRYAAELSNVSMETLKTGLGILSRNLFDAASGTGEAKDAFKLLGINIKDQSGNLRAIDDVLLDLAEKFSKLEDGTSKTALAMRIFGRSGAEMIPLLNEGASGITALTEEARAFGLVVGEDAAKKAETFNDNLTRTKGLIKGITVSIGNELIPAINNLTEAWLNYNKRIRETPSIWKEWEEMWRKISPTAEINKKLQGIGVMKGGEFLIGEGPGGEVLKPSSTKTISKEKKKTINLPTEEETKRQQKIKDIWAEFAKNVQKVNIEMQLHGEKINVNSELAKIYEETLIKLQQNGIKPTAKEIRNLVASFEEFNAAGKMQNVWSEFAKSLKSLNLEIELHGEDVDANTQLIEIYETAIKNLVQNGIDPASEAVKNLTTALEEIKAAQGREAIEQLTADLEIAQKNVQKLFDEIEHGGEVISETTNPAEYKKFMQEYHDMIDNLKSDNDSFSAGWKETLRKYVGDTDSMFSLGVDMARRTAQAMQSAFNDFFFDLFEGKIRNLKDLMGGLAHFVEQLAAEIISTILTTKILTSIGFAPKAHEGGMVKRFALGGPVFANADSVPALLTPGEYVVSRKGVDFLNRINQGQMPLGNIREKVTVNIVNSGRDEKPQVITRRQLDELIIDVIWRNYNQNGALRGLMRA